MHDSFHRSPAYLELQPLRIPAGWLIVWNTLYTPSETNSGDFGGTSIFNATNPGRRFNIDVAFKPEFDPDGEFQLSVLYQPWPRTEKGRRRLGLPFFIESDAESLHAFATKSYPELVSELEEWIARCSVWDREGH